MIHSFWKKARIFLVTLFFSFCGTNTDTPMAPFVFLVPIGIPQIANVLPIHSNINDNLTFKITGAVNNPKPEFLLKYFVVNREPQFVGYNLYITSAVPSVAETLTGEYLEDGIQPSFRHQAIEASTEPSAIQIRRIENRIPPPGITPFQSCQVFNFTLRAFFNNGLISNQSTPVSRCASTTPATCEVGTSCNPSICTNPSCSVGQRASCPVGTVCNPCVIPGQEFIGCGCPSGISPPGCNN